MITSAIFEFGTNVCRLFYNRRKFYSAAVYFQFFTIFKRVQGYVNALCHRIIILLPWKSNFAWFAGYPFHLAYFGHSLTFHQLARPRKCELKKWPQSVWFVIDLSGLRNDVKLQKATFERRSLFRVSNTALAIKTIPACNTVFLLYIDQKSFKKLSFRLWIMSFQKTAIDLAFM